MAARRLILAMLVLLVLSSILAALVPVERDRLRGDSSSTSTTTEATTEPAGKLVRRTVGADDATPERIELALGDQLELTVTSPKLADQVEIPAFGQLADVDPDFPARFDVLALETGSFPVRLVEARRMIAPHRRQRPRLRPEGRSEGRQLQGLARLQHRDRDRRRQLRQLSREAPRGLAEELRRPADACRGGSACPSGSGSRPGAGCSAAALAALRGLRWPGPSFGPQPAIGSSATSMCPASSSISANRSVSPAK